MFIVEGEKGISEFLNSDFELEKLYTTETIFDLDQQNLITNSELKKISNLKTPNTALAVFKIPDSKPIESKFILALDNVRDPGNLGTIIRLCDWFGIEDLVCNFETVDCYNPKVVQSTMGSLSRVNVSYSNLENFLKGSDLPTFGTFMDGENIYGQKLPNEGVVILGNEANGISKSIESLTEIKLAIPRFGRLKNTESLNVAAATAIVLSEFKRNTTER